LAQYEATRQQLEKTFDKAETLQRLAAKLEQVMEEVMGGSQAPVPTPATPAKRLSDQDIEERFRVPYRHPSPPAPVKARTAIPVLLLP
jgi:hypothetical protein